MKKLQIRMTAPTIFAPSFSVSVFAIRVASPASRTSWPNTPPSPRIKNQEVTKLPIPPEYVVRKPSHTFSPLVTRITAAVTTVAVIMSIPRMIMYTSSPIAKINPIVAITSKPLLCKIQSHVSFRYKINSLW